MKNIKRLLSVLLSVTTVVSLSSVAFADKLNKTKGYYKVEPVIENINNEPVTEIGPGSEVYLSIYLRAVNDDKTDIDIDANDSNKLSYALYVPAGLLANEGDYKGMSSEQVTTDTKGVVKVTDQISTYNRLYVVNDLKDYITGGMKIEYNKPLAKHKLKISDDANGSYTFTMKSGTVSDVTNKLVAMGIVKGENTLTLNVDKTATKATEPVKDPKDSTKDYTESGKVLKYVSSIANGADATKKVEITKKTSEGTATQLTEKTLADLLNGVATEGSKITAKISLGVLTADTDAVFSFELK